MTTNKLGKGTKNIGLNMPIKEAAEFEKRAKSMGISTGAYCKRILREWISSGRKMTITE